MNVPSRLHRELLAAALVLLVTASGCVWAYAQLVPTLLTPVDVGAEAGTGTTGSH